MTVKYGFMGLSGQFYPLADDPMTAQAALDEQGIAARLVHYSETTQTEADECVLW